MNIRNGKRGWYCSRAWGWKGRTFCVRGRFTGFHLGRHRDADGVRF